MQFLNLPNETPAPNSNNLTSEADRYYQLYNNLNRTKTGTESFTSASSGRTYSTNNYPTDVDVYNKGQEGLMNLLFKYVLRQYIVVADAINQVIELSNSVTIDVTSITYNQPNSVYEITLDREPTSTIYSIRFRTPNNYVAGNNFSISYTNSSGEPVTRTFTPVLSGTDSQMPSNTFVTNRVVSANVDNTLNTITFDSASSPVEFGDSPSSNSGIWIDSSDNTLKYWDGSEWVPIVGVWG